MKSYPYVQNLPNGEELIRVDENTVEWRGVTVIKKDSSFLAKYVLGMGLQFWRYLWWMEDVWNAGFPGTGRTVWIPRDRYDMFDDGTLWLDHNTLRTLRHELIHLEQRDRDGAWVFTLSYALWPEYRFRYEAEAYEPQINAKAPVLRAEYAQAIANALRSKYFVWPRPTVDDMARRMLDYAEHVRDGGTFEERRP